MKGKPRKQIGKRGASQVWINPNSTFKGPQSIRAGEHRSLAPPTAARLLELADTALGLKKDAPLAKQKKTAA